MQYVNQIAGTIVNFLTEKAGEQLGYLMHYRSHINDLKEKAENLQNDRERVQRQIDAAKRNVEEIELKVQKWVKDVDALTKDATEFLEADQAKANHRCFNGWCINLCSRYKFGKEAYEKASEITKHQDPKFESVSYPAPLPEIESSSSSSKIFSAYESRQSTVKQIIKALEETSINVIGICGMGGVGKTTIVEEVRRQAKEKKLFDEIAMVVVSQTPSLTKIQDGIASKLGVSFGTSDDESERARKLWARIQREKKILVILDDVWAWLDLKKVGIPFGEDHMGCKLVLTSRSQDVCNEMNAQKIFPIKVLSEKEAWVLFREMVGEAVEYSSDLNLIAREVARECGGLPLVIVTVGRALKNRSKYEWIDAARQLKKSIPTTIKGMDAYVYSSLELSYNYLEKEAKSFFLLCSLFPEDAYIPVEEMVKYGMGLRLFQGVDTIEDGRVRAHALVSALVSSFLLLDDDNEGVKMHDVVRDVAISIASSKDENNKYLVKAGIGLRDWPDSDDTTSQNYTGISLMETGIQKLPDELECPKLETLLLQQDSYYIELQIPTNFFRGMRNLKVLDMSGNQIAPLPPSLPLLTTLRTLRLDKCRLGDVSIIGTLKQLEILSLFGSNIDAIPGHFAQLTHLRLLDIRRCKDLRHISAGVLSSLCKLEELYTYEDFSYWAVGDEDSKSSASLTELTSLSRLTTLHVFAPNADKLPHDLKFQNLINFHISIGYHKTCGGAEYKKRLNFTYDTRLSGPIEVLVKRTEALCLGSLNGLKNMLKDLNDNNGFDELKYLHIDCCREMKYLLDMVDWVSPGMAFRNLEKLFVDSLDDFSEICHGQLPAESFGKVRELTLWQCPSISSIVSSDLLRRLQYLKLLVAGFCGSLLNVFDLEGLANEGEDIELLSRLEELNLQILPKLMHIWKGTHHFVNLRNLRSILLNRCGKLRQLFPPSLVQGLVRLEVLFVHCCSNLEEIFGTQEEEEEKETQTEIIVVGKINSLRASSTSLQNLTRVCLDECDRLRNIFTPYIAKGLVQLRELEIFNCAMMEAAVGGRGDKKGEVTVVASSSIDQEKKIVFPRLSRIQLFELDSLTCFCTGSYAVEFPSLEHVLIYRCPKMETFGHGVQITPNLKKVQFSRDVDEFIWMGDLNATVRHIFKQKIWAKPPEQGAQSR